MLSVYKSFHQRVKYDQQRNCILENFTGLGIKIFMKPSKTQNRFQIDFKQPKSGLQTASLFIYELKKSVFF